MVNDIPAGVGNIEKLFLQCIYKEGECSWVQVVHSDLDTAAYSSILYCTLPTAVWGNRTLN